MKIVAVSQRVDDYADRNEHRDALDQRLINFLYFVGFLPVPVPNNLVNLKPDVTLIHEPLDVWLDKISPKAIILSGGNDIGQYPERDSTEVRLLEYSRKNKLPVLGICRGMQMMAHLEGTELHLVEGHVNTRHQLTGKYKDEVNSYHCFSIAECPKDFDVQARSADGEIEAIRHRCLKWEGWMWHPERESQFATNDIERLKKLFDA